MTTEITPIRQQYLDIKKQYPHAILFFRLGDFYETFDKDAEITSQELEIVLTSRNVAKGQRVPMAGIPYHAVDNYLARLIKKGYHVAICEQLSDQPEKGLVPRKVVKVITPGTVMETELLPGGRNNYLACLLHEENRDAIAYLDITTGEFRVTQIDLSSQPGKTRDEINRLNPAEILVEEEAVPQNGVKAHRTVLPKWKSELRNCEDALKKQLGVTTLDGYGLRGKSLMIRAAGAVLLYLQDTQPTALKLLNSLSTYSLDEFVALDHSTFRNLEVTANLRDGTEKGSLLHTLDHTMTPMGQRLILQWLTHPLMDIGKINDRYDWLDFFINQGILRAEIRAVLKSLNDLERLTNKVIAGNAIPRDLAAIRETLHYLPAIQTRLLEKTLPQTDSISPVLPDCSAETALLDEAIVDTPPATLQKTGIIRPGFSAELDQLIESSQHAREWIANLESVEKERTGIKNLKVGYNKVFGYYIEITNSNTGAAPADYIRKQTLVNAERYITPEMKEYETLVLNAEDQIHEVEIRVFRSVITQLAAGGSKLLHAARTLALIDVLSALAEAAVLKKYTRPQVSNDNALEIYNARHPVVELMLSDKRFIPNDIILEPGEIVRIITGPNMSGKSTFLRQAALIVLMAQMGSFIPAENAKIGLVDRIFTRIGAQDEIHAGQSTFMVEMVETANILNNASPRSLLILDEIGRGTSTYDGVSIAWAVVEFIHNHPALRSRTFFATHYHELMQLSQILPGVRNYNVAVTESGNSVVFLHKIVPGGSDRSYGIHVGELAGLPQPVIQRAVEILKNLESTSGRTSRTINDPSVQMTLFPETNPLVNELDSLDVNAISPIQALTILYEWKKRFGGTPPASP